MGDGRRVFQRYPRAVTRPITGAGEESAGLVLVSTGLW